MEMIDYDGEQRRWLLWKFIAFTQIQKCHTKSAKGSRWGKELQKVGDLENIFKYLYPTLEYPEFSKTLFYFILFLNFT